MAEERLRYPDWARDTRLPNPPPPPLSCDCQFHVYEETYPPKWRIRHELPKASFAESCAMHRALGVDRAVLVHASVYDSDYRIVKNIMTALPDRSHLRGVVVVNDDSSDRELEELSALGVCGGRFHITRRYKALSKDLVARTLARLRELGWHARLHVDPPLLAEYGELFDKARGVEMVIDHLGHLDFARGLTQPAMAWMMERVKNRGWWMMVSNGNRLSALETGWSDADPFARAFIESAPDRVLWASDWPHVRWRKQRMMNDAETVELLYRYVGHDPAMIRRILVDNPARLHNFPRER